MRRAARILSDTAAVVATVLAFALTHLPAPAGVGLSEADSSRIAVRAAWRGLADARDSLPAVPDAIPGDKLIHVGLYLVPAALLASSLALRHRLAPGTAAALLAALGLWAAADETTQTLLGRDGEPGDVVANVLGAALGIAATALAVRLTRPWRHAR